MRGTEKIFVNNNELKLEAELFQSSVENLLIAALVLHPHPQFFGI